VRLALARSLTFNVERPTGFLTIIILSNFNYGQVRAQMDQANFQKLDVYKRSKELVKLVYSLIKQFPIEERFALCDQLRRAVISVPSNIAEGTGRWSLKEQLHHIEYAFGSLAEVLSQMDIAHDLGYISEEELDHVLDHYFAISRMLSGLKNSLETRLNTQSQSGSTHL